MRASPINFDLNNAQRKAVTYDGDNALLVLAGSGSGKTRVLAQRVAQLIANGEDPGRILLLTFTRNAAEEMTSRVENLIAPVSGQKRRPATSAVRWAGTFHSVGLRMLRLMPREVRLKPEFTVLDAQDARELMGQVRGDLGLQAKLPAAKICSAVLSYRTNARRKLDQVLSEEFPEHLTNHSELAQLFKAYNTAKKQQNVVDFDDLLRLCAHSGHYGQLIRFKAGSQSGSLRAV